MKKFLFLLLTCILFSAILLNADDKVIELSTTPEAVQNFIRVHFADQTVARVEKDRHTYEVSLQNGTEINFNKQGEWVEVDMKDIVLPESVVLLIPQNIRSYIEQNYVGRSIESVKKSRRGYELGLMGNPDVELKFNKAGDFLRIDD